MDFIREHTTAVLGGIIAVAVIAGYFLFFGGSAPVSSLQVIRPESGADKGISQELLATLLELHSITLDTSVWVDPSFQSLRDFGVALAPAPVGRDNPFAPLGSASRAAQTTTTSGAQQGAKPLGQ